MKGYSVKITDAIVELTAKEKIMCKDFTNATSLDEATTENDELIINVANVVTCEVHNEKSDNKDYIKYVVIDTAGNKFVTGSESFATSLLDIVDEMHDAGEEEITIKVYRMDSKNYKGKQFITCSVI